MFDQHFKDVETITIVAFSRNIKPQELVIKPDNTGHTPQNDYHTGIMIGGLLEDFKKTKNINIQEAYTILYKQVETHLLSQFKPCLTWNNMPEASKSKLSWLKELGIIDQVYELAEQLFKQEVDKYIEAERAKKPFFDEF